MRSLAAGNGRRSLVLVFDVVRKSISLWFVVRAILSVRWLWRRLLLPGPVAACGRIVVVGGDAGCDFVAVGCCWQD